MPRKLPLLTEINIFLFNLTFAILHVVLKPIGLEQTMAALCFGNLFGIILPYFGVIACLVHIAVGPLLDRILFIGAYESIVLNHAYRWFGVLLLWNFAVACTDGSHRDVEGGDSRFSSVAKMAFCF
mmetsp:Transcript_28560/g.68753  ORF Transcript_28560/g.68753 Transcript_28560/m.68753 type:complete len:126 (-) Transcript_28560:125-502(-)